MPTGPWRERILGDPSHRIYIASTLSNWKKVRELIKIFEFYKITITMDWTLWGEQIFSKKCDTKPDFDKDVLAQKAEEELSGVLDARYLLVVLPGGKGTHFEYGAFYTLHHIQRPPDNLSSQWKAPITILDEVIAEIPTSFHYLESVHRTFSREEAVTAVLNYFDIPAPNQCDSIDEHDNS